MKKYKERVCELCGKTHRETTGKYCQKCYNYLRKHPEGIYELPKKGQIAYAYNGDVICHICGMAYGKLGNHIYNKHKMTQEEYREKFGLYRNTKLTNEKYKELMRNYNNKYKEIVVNKNLIENGKNTRLDKKTVKRKTKGLKTIQKIYLKVGN